MRAIGLAILGGVVLGCATGSHEAASLSPPSASVSAPTAALTPNPTSAPTAALTPNLTAALTPSASTSDRLVTTDVFQVKIPVPWKVDFNPTDDIPVTVTSPTATAKFSLYWPVQHEGHTLAEYAGYNQGLFEDKWHTHAASIDATIAGVPAVRLEATETGAEPRTHVVYYMDYPAGSGDTWELLLENAGSEADPAFAAIAETFRFLQ